MMDRDQIVMVLAFLVYDLLLLGSNRLCGYPPGHGRVALAAVLGAVHARVCLLPGFLFLGNPVWHVIVLGCMSLLAYGMTRSAIRRSAIFLLLSLAVEGITSGGGWAVIVAAVLIYLLGFISKQPAQKTCIPLSVTCGDQTLSLLALVDTGNTLRDPISGVPVVILGQDAAWRLLSLTDAELSHPIQTITQRRETRLRLIPYSAVGMPAGFLLGCRADSVILDGNVYDCIVAFAPQIIGKEHTFQALAGGNL